MKNILLLTLSLAFVLSICVSDAFANGVNEKPVCTESVLLVEKEETDRAWLFEVSTNWSAKNFAYGPVEILAGAGIPIIGMFGGIAAGVAAPHYFMRKGCEALIPITIPCGMAAGATLGLALTPLCVIEGVFDTLTCGAFADGYFSWIDTGDLKCVSVQSVEDQLSEDEEVEVEVEVKEEIKVEEKEK